jgi:glucose/mannose-6-phosphate isomerase
MTREAALDNPARLAALDPHGAGKALAEFPAQCRQAARLTASPPPGRFVIRHVVFAGMGGSALGGDLVSTLATERLSVPVTVWRGYGLPSFVGPDSLVVAVSYSGDTEETLSAFEAALRRRAPAVAVTSGGALGKLAVERELPLVRVPGGLMPRFALGHLFFPLLTLLESLGLTVVGEPERDEAIGRLEVMGEELRVDRAESDNEAKRLALTLRGRTPVIYGSALTEAPAYRWKTELEENAKLLAFHGRLPEADHNEVEGWRDPSARVFHAVFLRDPLEDEETVRRVLVTQELIRDGAGGVTDVWPRGKGRPAHLLSLIYLGDWVSYYLALLRGVDPWSVPALSEVKRRLREAKSRDSA